MIGPWLTIDWTATCSLQAEMGRTPLIWRRSSGQFWRRCQMPACWHALGRSTMSCWDTLMTWQTGHESAKRQACSHILTRQCNENSKGCAHTPLGRYPDNLARRRFLDRADPWVIAHAIVNGGTVVTHEKRNPDASYKVKIPNMCERFNVNYIDAYQMLRDQGAAWDR